MGTEFYKLVADFCELKFVFMKTAFCKLLADFCELEEEMQAEN